MGCLKLSYEHEREGLELSAVFFGEGLKKSATEQNFCTNYYPFGLHHSSSWTRVNDLKNNFLFNAGSELNEQTKNYETPFRQYDPALGRFTGIDALASSFSSWTPYQFAYNDPIAFNDPTGLQNQSGLMGDMYGRGAEREMGPSQIGRKSEYGSGWYGPSFEEWAVETGNYDLLRAGHYTRNNDGNFTYTPLDLNSFYVYNARVGSIEVGGSEAVKYETRIGVHTQASGGNPFPQADGFGIPSSPFTGSRADGTTYFEGVRVNTSEVGALKNRAAFTLPGAGIFVNPADKYNIPLLKHEFGHILQYRKFGAAWYAKMATESVISANRANHGLGDHQSNWTEWTANFLSYQYFGDTPATWDTIRYPIAPSLTNPSYPPMSPFDFYGR